VTNEIQNNSRETETNADELTLEQLEQVGGGASVGGGMGAGKVSMQDFHFVMRNSTDISA
jgi:hypothetical protein